MKTILSPIDFSDATNQVMEAAGALAQALPAKIVLTHVIRPAVIVSEYSPVLEKLALADQNRTLEQLSYWQQELKNDGFTVETSQLYGQPADCIRDEAERLAADYIVLGSHGHGALYDLVVGSTASSLLKQAPCPVLVVPVTGIKPPPSDSNAHPDDQTAKRPASAC
jgi:nucleotide-binding universal stress UspA family protein